MLHDGRATYPRHLRVSSSTTGGRPTRDTPCHTERRVPSLPAPSPENRTLCVSCVLAQERVHICPRLFCDLLHYLAPFFLITECSCSNECQMLQRLAIFIRAVGRVAAQADSTTACQTPLHVANLPSDCWSANNPSFKSPQHVSRPVVMPNAPTL
jgi:hypothetical protein